MKKKFSLPAESFIWIGIPFTALIIFLSGKLLTLLL
jgi:hypothetical protein